nr:RHS repeat-associated core domain-containing protein [Corallococcus exiguus]
MPEPGWSVTSGAEGVRTLHRPDGVSVVVLLTDYGNSQSTKLPGLNPSLESWGSAARGGPVQVDVTTTSEGRAFRNAFNGDLQLNGVTLEAAPEDSLPVPGAALGAQLWSVTERHPQTGRVTGMTVATGHGDAAISRPLSSSGDPTGVTLTDPTHGVLFSTYQSADPDGVVQSGQDSSGNSLTFSGHETQPLGLPRYVQVTRALEGAGGLATYQVEYQYDDLGNRISERNNTTGAQVQSTYDAVGRLLSRTVAGSPGQSWTYDYVLAEDALTITQTLALGKWGRNQSTTTKYQQGLKREERYFYGRGNSIAFVAYMYEGTKLLWYSDARGKVHTPEYDSAGRVTSERVAGKTAYTRVLDADGNVSAITNDNGLTTHIGYDKLGRPVRWAYESKGSGDPCSEECQFADVETVELDAAGALVKSTFGTLEKKHVLESVSDAMGRGRAVRSADGSHGGIHSETEYDPAGRILHRQNIETGVDEAYAYDDALGRLTRYVRTVESADGAKTLTETRTYQDDSEGPSNVVVRSVLSGETGNAASIRDETRTYVVDVQGRVLSSTEMVDGQQSSKSWEYDALGRESASRDANGRLTTYEYDTSGNLLLITWPGNITTEFTYDADGNVLTQTGPREGESWTMTYDSLGRLETRTLNGQTPVAEWTYSYLGGGVEVEIEPEGTVISRTRNARGSVDREVRTGGEGEKHELRIKYDGPWVKRQTAIEGTSIWSLSRDTASAIDDQGRTRSETESWSSSTYSYAYITNTSWVGRTATVAESWAMNGSDLGGRTVTTQVDSLGNVVRQSQAGAQDEWEYYADGRPMRSHAHGFGSTEMTRWAYETSGRVKSMNFGGELTSYTYYKDGSLQSETAPDNRVRSLTYNSRGLLEAMTYGRDGDFSRVRYAAHDKVGHATEVQYADGPTEALAWRYQYGPRDELLKVIPPGGGESDAFKYTYDAMARLTGIQSPMDSDAPGVTYGYDFLGREALRKRVTANWTTTWKDGSPEVQNPLNERIKRIIDGRGRVVHEVVTARTATEDSAGASKVYKDLDSVDYVFNGLDQLRSATENRTGGPTVRTLQYDSQDRLVSSDSNGADMVSYGYHDSGALKSVTSPSGTVKYGVGALQRLNLVTLADNTELTVRLEAGGKRVAMVGNAALKHTYCYNRRGSLASVTHDAREENCSGFVSAPSLRYRYTYDEQGNRLTEVVDRFLPGSPGSTETTQYGYDAADRLTGVAYPDGQSVLYALNKDGSRYAEKTVTGYTGPLNESGFGTATQPQQHLVYFYDALRGLKETQDALDENAVVAKYKTDFAGRLVSEQRGDFKRLLHFDAAGRLVEAELKDGAQVKQSKYQYDYAGLRRSKTTGTEATKYIWSGETLIEEHLPGSAGHLLYQRGAGLTVAVGSERVALDGLGSMVARFQSGGSATHYRYDAWGNYRNSSSPTSAQASIGYTGHSWDADTGLTYGQQRWYDATTGRFVSEDPLDASAYLGVPMGMQPWGYANGNPTRLWDPDGRQAEPYGAGDGMFIMCSFSSLIGLDQSFCADSNRVAQVAAAMNDGQNRGMRASAALTVSVGTGGLGGAALGIALGYSSELAQQTYSDPRAIRYWEELDHLGALERSVSLGVIPAAFSGVKALGVPGKLAVSGALLYFGGATIGEGVGQFAEARAQRDPGRAVYSASLLLSGALSGAGVYGEAVRAVPYGRLPKWAAYKLDFTGEGDPARLGSILGGVALIDPETGLPVGSKPKSAPQGSLVVRKRNGDVAVMNEDPFGKVDAKGLPPRPESSPHYSTVFEAQLTEGVHYPGQRDGIHFAEANKQLYEAMRNDPVFAKRLEQLFPGLERAVNPGARGAFSEDAPKGLTWHHEANRKGVMQLLPLKQHQAAGPVQHVLHPGQKGGMENWGGKR